MTQDDSRLVYIIDDEESVLDSLTILVKRKTDLTPRTFATAARAMEGLEEKRPAVVVTDIAMDGREAGIEILERSRELWPDVPVILMSAVASREAAIEAVNHGAFHFLEKPFDQVRLVGLLRQALRRSEAQGAARTTARQARASRSTRHNHPGARRAEALEEWQSKLVGESDVFLECLALVEQAAATEATVLLTGESGTGKGVLASYLHECSARSGQPLRSVNCGALTETLLESQLFGHVKGAFTGADRDHDGLLRAADGGTFFLDEVSEMSPATQVKLLRVLQEREVIPVGGTEARDVDVRFIAATNKDLRRRVADGRFREDLFWRLHVFPVEVPPLRARAGDITLLAEHALEGVQVKNPDLGVRRIDGSAMELLNAYSWPGNVRELENAIERAAIVSNGEIAPSDLPDHVRAGAGRGGEEAGPPADARAAPPSSAGALLAREMPPLAVLERAYAAWVVDRHDGDLVAAAGTLGLPVATLRALLEGGKSSGS